MPRALFALCQMHLHANKLHTWKCVVNEWKVLIAEFPTVHVAGFEGSDTSTLLGASGSEPLSCHGDHN